MNRRFGFVPKRTANLRNIDAQVYCEAAIKIFSQTWNVCSAGRVERTHLKSNYVSKPLGGRTIVSAPFLFEPVLPQQGIQVVLQLVHVT